MHAEFGGCALVGQHLLPRVAEIPATVREISRALGASESALLRTRWPVPTR